MPIGLPTGHACAQCGWYISSIPLQPCFARGLQLTCFSGPENTASEKRLE